MNVVVLKVSASQEVDDLVVAALKNVVEGFRVDEKPCLDCCGGRYVLG